MSIRQNAQSRARRRTAKRLIEIITEFDIPLREIAKKTGIDLVTLTSLSKFTPHLATIEKLSKYLEAYIKEEFAKRKANNIVG